MEHLRDSELAAIAVGLLDDLTAAGLSLRVEDDKLKVRGPRQQLTAARRAAIEENRDALIALLRAGGDGQAAAARGITPQARPDRPPLSYAQTRLWFLHRLEGPSATYNIPLALRLEGELDVAALRAALGDVVARHESLRTVFAEHEGEPWQRVLPADEVHLALPLAALDESMLDAALSHAAHDAFELDREIPLRTRLWQLGPRTHVLMVLLHHIAGDGWSAGPLARELAQAYAARRAGTAPSWPALPLQYIDYAIWQRARLGREEDAASPMARQLAFWRSALADAPQELPLPADFERPAQPSYRGASIALRLDAGLHARALTLAHASSASLFMVMHAALAGLLSRLGAGSDIVIGTPIAGRNEQALEGLIGFFVNTLVLRCDTGGRPSLRELIARVRKFDLDAYAHQDLPFERLVDALAPPRVPGRNPLFQVLLALQNVPPARLALPGIDASLQPLHAAVAKFDLGFNLLEHHRDGQPAGITGTLDYSAERFSEETARALAERWPAWLQAACAEADRPLAELPLLSLSEAAWLRACNDTAHPLPAGTLVELFDAQAARTPEATALVFDGRSLSYAELKRRANRLAHGLVARGVGPEAVVGIALERSLERPIAILGVLKAGAAYLPLDPKAPPARRAQLLEEARPRWILEDPASWPDGAAEHDVAAPPRRAQYPAYVLYTSGSTGRPKGVVVTHAGLVSLALAQSARLGIEAHSRALQFASIEFDASMAEISTAWLRGATLVLPRDEERSGPALQALLQRERISHATLPPVVLATLDPAALPGLVGLIVAGEACPAQLAARWAPGRTMVNGYGPTESTVCATMSAPLGGEAPPPIGTPIWNTRVHLLDAALHELPPNVVGELYIAGAGLARGYLGRPGLTAERFVADPFGPPGTRLYRSGDLALRRPDGRLEFIGRADQQIKLRGMRIEPGEIEAVLREHAQVGDARVLLHAEPGATAQLLGYVIARRDAALAEQERSSRVARWQQLYDATSYADAATDPGFNIAGWNDSYSGAPIPPAQMREWVEHTVARIAARGARRVLEIGCGTGLLLTRLAPGCERYIGADFSQRVLGELAAHVATRADLAQVELHCAPAHELGFVESGSVDLVILNSVAQYFPDAGYLRRVLGEARRVLREGGALFIGDVRNLALLGALHASVQWQRAGADISSSRLRQRVEQSMWQEEELLVDGEFFVGLAEGHGGWRRAELWPKAGNYDNELSRFRYDAWLIAAAAGEPAQQPQAAERIVDWDAEGRWNAALQQTLADAQPLLLRGLTDRRAAPALALWQGLQSGADVQSVRRASEAAQGADLDALQRQAAARGIELAWRCDAEGRWCVLVAPRWQPVTHDAPRHSRPLANTPTQAQAKAELATALLAHLRDRLPSHMVPASISVLPRWPLTPGGKLDRRALPVPGRPEIDAAAAAAPRTPVEILLCTLFAEVLGLPRVDIRDGFFALGGDSILAILLVSRAQRAGLAFSLRDVFQHQSVEALATVALPTAAPLAEADGEALGDWPAMPVMREFIARGGPLEHFSQTLTLQLPAEVKEADLLVALQALIDGHAMLRLRASIDGGTWRFAISPRGCVRAGDCLRHAPHPPAVDALAGRMIDALWQPGPAPRLTLTLHHFAVDAVSWHLLVADLAAAWRQAADGTVPGIAPVATPFPRWARHLAELAHGSALQAERPAWLALLSSGRPIWPDRRPGPGDTMASAGVVELHWSRDISDALLTRLPRAIHANADAVLLAGLALAVAQLQRQRGLATAPFIVDLEGHGRFETPAGLDLSRTVGWFTSVHPVSLEARADDPGTVLKQVKEQLRALPGGSGLGHGLLRWREGDPASELRSPAQIGFNYLGRSSRAEAPGAWMPVRGEPPPEPALPLPQLFAINAWADDESLHARCHWARSPLDEAEVRALCEAWHAALIRLAVYADEPGAGGHTPSDFPLVALSQAAVDTLAARDARLEDILPLAPLQQGLLYHALLDRDSDVYTVQLVLALDGPLDADRLRQAGQALLQRHANLRVAFHAEGGEAPVQVVLREAELPWRFEDGASIGADVQAAWRGRLLLDERTRPWDLAQPPLLRLALLRLARQRHLLALTNHHLLIDGWSMPVFFAELFALYHGESPLPPPAYRNYLAWLARHDLLAARERWRRRLEGVEPMRVALPAAATGRNTASQQRREHTLAAGPTARLQALVRAHGLTLGTLVQGLWALLLARLLGRGEVVFGVTVAGRPAEVPGVDRMLGLFINTLPWRTSVPRSMPLMRWLAECQQRHVEWLDDAVLGLAEIQRLAGQPELFDSLMVVENYPVGPGTLEQGELRLGGVEGWDRTHYPLTLLVAPGERLRLRVDHDPQRFPVAQAARLGERLERLLLSALDDPMAALGALDLWLPHERAGLSRQVPPQPLPASTLTGLLRLQLERTPQAAALICGDELIDYAELHRRAGRLARAMVAMGVGPEDRVAVMLPRSPALVVTLLATLQAGAAYLPIDPAYPEARRRLMLEIGRPKLVIDEGFAAGAEATSLPMPHPDNPACVIFTSGSTGVPKAVVVSHRAMANHMAWMASAHPLTAADRVLARTSVSFDAAGWELWLPLVSGAAMVLADDEEVRDADRLLALMAKQRVSVAQFVPSLLATVLDASTTRPPALRAVHAGGEALTAALAERVQRQWQVPLTNLYGPTETTIDTSTWTGPPPPAGTVPIGHAIWNTALHVLDGALEPVPPGFEGELYIGGLGLARGYFGRPAATAERFVADPHGPPGARLYRSGDRVRRDADGTLEFIGRADAQIKLRGVRIEPGEIEAALFGLPGIRQCAVVVHGDGAARRLVAYIVADGADDWPRQLAAKLPPALLPSAFVTLPGLPLTPNGKLDRATLPAPGLEARRRAPTTLTQRLLCRLYADVLGLDEVGIDDSFFSLGGDSIQSMLLVSRARRAGLAFGPREVFEHPSVEALAAWVDRYGDARVPVPIEDEPDAEHDVPLTPIMRSFLARGGSHVGFHQSMRVPLPAGIDDVQLKRALQALLDRHEMLRARLHGDRLIVPPRVSAAAVSLQRADALPPNDLDPAAGRMLHAVRLPRSDGDMLHLAIHHLAVDAVSWQILLPDLQSACEQAMRGIEPLLDPVALPFHRWAQVLHDAASSHAVLAEAQRWNAIVARAAPLLPGATLDPQRDTVATTRTLQRTLDGATGAALLTTLPAAFHCGVPELLLAALAIAATRWRQDRGHAPGPIGVDIEGHGREPLDAGQDLTRTVGWFTTLYPITLDAEPDAGDAARAIKRAKVQLRATPGRGLGYGLLRESLAAHAPPQLAFNYLGRIAGGSSGAGSFGGGADPDLALTHLIDINALALDGTTLTARWSWASRHIDEADAAALADAWCSALQDFAARAAERGFGGHAPCDFPLVSVDLAGLEALESARPRLADLLPLAPLQQGLLFHALHDASADVYVVQTAIELEGELDPPCLRSAAQAVLRRHASLRAAMHQADGEQLLQVIESEVELPWREFELTGQPPEERERLLAAEQHEPFDPAHAPLLRLALLRLAPGRHLLALTHHHLAMDGWSTPIFFDDLLHLYRGAELSPVPPWRDHLARLARQDKSAALAAWRDHLEGLDAPLLLAAPARDTAEAYRRSEHDLPEATTARLQAFARDHGLTLNTLLQAAWALLLGRLSGRGDVVFGITVSGRPPELPSVERMVGLFINTVPLRLRLLPGEPVGSLLQRLQHQQARLIAAQHVGLAEIQRAEGLGELFDSLLVFENYPLPTGDTAGNGPRVVAVHSRDRTHYPLALLAVPGPRLRLRVDIDASRFAPALLNGIAGWLATLLDAIATAPHTPLHRLPLVDAGARRQWVDRFNPAFEPAAPLFVAERFALQAARTPEAMALIDAEQRTSYAQLDRDANRLAHRLIAHGAGPEHCIAVVLDRSPALVVAMLAIWKAGACYVPLDPELPDARLAAMLADCRPALLLTSRALAPRTTKVEQLLVDDPAETSQDTAPSITRHPDHPCYLIYTSGSTGRPKGIVQTTRTLANLMAWSQPGEPAPVVAQFTSIGFDVSVQEVLYPLLHGGTLAIPDAETRVTPQALAAFVEAHQVTALFAPDIVLALLADAAAERGRALPTLIDLHQAGEALQPTPALRAFQALQPRRRLHNHYGPAETHVVTAHTLGADAQAWAPRPPIGAAIRNTRLYVLDAGLEPVPVGVVGELYIAGDGLARGYLGAAAATAERFVADPYGPSGSRIYRSGDLARRRGDGLLEYVGRADQQVKLRGQRVEPGEIAALLRAQPGIAHAVVVARDDGPGGVQLVGYVVPVAGAAIDPDALRASLAATLPEVMVPAALVRLERLPLTPNGKLDRRALPAPERPADSIGRAPASALEALLCRLAAEVLSLPAASVGPDDDFYALGGDSILSILLVGRARREGWQISPRDVLKQRRLGALAALARPVVAVAAAASDAGPFEPTPIMRWLFERGGAIERFSMSVLLQVPAGLREADLQRALQSVLDTHDSLRLRCRLPQGPLDILPRGSVAAGERLVRVDLSRLDHEAQRAAMGAAIHAAECRLDPGIGRVVEAVWFSGSAADRLYLAVHHLAVDGVSWRILAGDLAAAWSAVARGEAPSLAPVPGSFRSWALRAAARAASPEVLAELPYWLAMAAHARPLVEGSALDPSLDTVATARTLRLALDVDTTTALLTRVPAAFHARIDDVLLAALVLAVQAWRGEQQRGLWLDIEGHGRELNDGDALDLSRTTGWFTSLYPLWLDPSSSDPATALKRVKEQLRAVPGRGIGHGLLRYLNPQTAPQLAALPAPQFGFNYLGRFAADAHADWVAASGDEPLLSPGMAPAMPLAHLIELTPLTLDGPEGPSLRAHWSWAGRHLAEAEVRALAEDWMQALHAIAALAAESGAGGHTPSDFPLVRIGQAELERIEAERPQLAELLPLTPLQEGLLFHSLYDGDAADAYVVQIAAELSGPLEPGRLRAAAQALLARHPHLGGRVWRRGSAAPLLLIARDDALPCQEIDLPALDDAALDAWLEADRATRIDLERGPPLRLALLRRGPERHRLVSTHHHIAMDGWSMPIYFGELFALLESRPLPAPRPWRDHLEGLARQDGEAARAAWQRHLAGLDGPMRLATAAAAAPDAKRWQADLAPALAARLQAFLLEHGLTAATLWQALWAVLLGRLAGGRRDVVFGLTVAGRPPELAGVESMIGLFVNTLPLRVRLDPAEALPALAARQQDELSQLLPSQFLGLAEIQRLAGHGELFDAHMVFENYPVDAAAGRIGSGPLRIGGLQGHDATHYPLALMVAPGERTRVRIDHDAARFAPGAVSTLGPRLLRLLEAVLDAPATPQHRLGWLDAAEQQRLGRWADGGPLPAAPGVIAAIEAQVSALPEATALLGDGASLSYRELGVEIARLAAGLRRRGLGAEQRVAVALSRTPRLPVALLACLKAGVTVMPLDPRQPRTRLQALLDDAGAALVLCEPGAERIDPRWHSIDEIRTGHDAAAAPPPPRRQQAAYLLHTSGSTGRPKGVVVTHGALADFLAATARVLPMQPADRQLALTTVSFDIAWLEWLLPLAQGAAVVIAGDDAARDPAALIALVRRHGVTSLQATPSLWPLLLREGGPALAGCRLLCGGEALPAELAQQLHAAGREAWNLYGPTEATIWASIERLSSSPMAAVAPIGRPLAGYRAYVLDAALQPLPEGLTGELYIAGAGLARGYLDQPATSAERFVADPFGPPGSRMYRSGDLARWASDGRLEFLGRADQQVKLRGLRIELGEIESVLRAQAGVAQAAVVSRDDGQGGSRQLVAYVVHDAVETATEARPEVAALQAALAQALPDYMLPASIVTLDALPLNASGKLDRRALPAPMREASAHRAPQTPQEALLCTLFAETLGRPQVGIDDDFFALGGDSLLAMRLVGRLRESFGIALPVRALFEAPRVAALAERCKPADDTGLPALTPQPRPPRPSLSYAQTRLWFLYRLEGPSATYNMPLALRLEGELDTAALHAAISDLIARQESLRTVYAEHDGQPWQQVLQPEAATLAFPLQPLDEASLEAVLAAAAHEPIDLAREIPLRARLWQLGRRTHVLLLVVHHIASDGWSMAPLARELAQAYAARLEGHPPGWPALPLQYIDYAIWQRSRLGSETDPSSPMAQQLAFWRSALAGAPEELTLPTDFARPAQPGYRGASIELALDPALHARALAIARGDAASLFMLLHAALAGLLSRLGAGDDIVIGSPIAGRGEPALEGLIGLFVNTLVLRCDTSGRPSLRELLARVRRFDLDAYAHQELPFERLVDSLAPPRVPGRNPLYQVMLALQNTPAATEQLPGLDVSPPPLQAAVAKVDLLINLVETQHDGEPAGITGTLDYSVERFSAATAQGLAGRWQAWLQAACAEPDRPLAELPLLSAAEEAQARAFNATFHPVPAMTIGDRFDAQAARTPDAIAVQFEGRSLSYAELKRRANRLAIGLIALGIGAEDRVGIALPRSLDLPVAVLGVLKAGAVYLPLDPNEPPARRTQMFEEARPRLVLDDITPWPEGAAHEVDNSSRCRALYPQHPAYVLYTSGSTGRPKGAPNTHEGLLNRFAWMRDAVSPGPQDAVLHKTPLGFDVSVWELLWPLLNGVRLVIATPGVHREPHALAAAIVRERITMIHFVPSLLQAFLDEPAARACTGVRLLVCSGEALPAAAVRQARRVWPQAVQYNLYGPTEASIEMSSWICRADDEQRAPPIGRPMWNMRLLVLDRELEPCPPGVAGEIYIGGIGLARGYLGRPGLTAERFVADPHGPPGERLYRSGDLARRRADGELEFLGRTDHQIKLRSQRIEPGEIEALLMQQPGVAQAAVVAHHDGPSARLVAYVAPDRIAAPALAHNVAQQAAGGVLGDDVHDLPAGSAPADPERWREALAAALKESLPEAMQPAQWVLLATLPLTGSGKLDRRSLPAPPRPEPVASRPPRNEREAELARLYAEILKLERVGVDDHFFAFGGHSLLAMRLVAQIRARLGLDCPVRLVFEAPTVAELAAALDANGAAEQAWSPLLTLRGAGSLPPLFCAAPSGGLGWAYAALLPALDTQRPLLALQADHRDIEAPLPASVLALAHEGLAELRRVQPRGPYHLLGYSLGGLVAHAIAVLLQQAGESVALLALLDSVPAAEDDPADAPIDAARFEAEWVGSETAPDIQQLIDTARRRGQSLGSLDAAHATRFRELALQGDALRRAYRPGRYEGPALLFVATGGHVDLATAVARWQHHISGPISASALEGSHEQMLEPQPLGVVARRIEAALQPIPTQEIP